MRHEHVFIFSMDIDSVCYIDVCVCVCVCILDRSVTYNIRVLLFLSIYVLFGREQWARFTKIFLP